MKKIILAVLIFSFIGILDAAYLTSEHYSNEIPPCSTSIWVDCGKVLRSEYATIGSMPLAVLGLIFYSTVFALAAIRLALFTMPQTTEDKIWSIVHKLVYPKNFTFKQWLLLAQVILTAMGVLSSAYFVYLQLGILRSICLYCMVSAINTVILFSLSVYEWKKEHQESTLGSKVKSLIKK